MFRHCTRTNRNVQIHTSFFCDFANGFRDFSLRLRTLLWKRKNVWNKVTDNSLPEKANACKDQRNAVTRKSFFLHSHIKTNNNKKHVVLKTIIRSTRSVRSVRNLKRVRVRVYSNHNNVSLPRFIRFAMRTYIYLNR